MANIKPPGRAARTPAQRWIAVNIRYRREQLGLTSKQLANKMNVQTAWISHVETGLNSNLSVDTLHDFASALNVDVGLLLREKPELWVHAERRGTQRITHQWHTN